MCYAIRMDTDKIKDFVNRHKRKIFPLIIATGLAFSACGKSQELEPYHPIVNLQNESYHNTGEKDIEQQPNIQSESESNQSTTGFQMSKSQQELRQAVAEMRAELADIRQQSEFFSDDWLRGVVGSELSEVNPILVGRNIVFDNNFLDYIGDDENGIITQENFIQWRDNLDNAFDALVYLTGRLPKDGQKVFVNLDNSALSGLAEGRAYNHMSQITLTRFWIEGELDRVNRTGSPGFLALHELAHVFEIQQPFRGHGESMANFFVSFMMDITQTGITERDMHGEAARGDFDDEKLLTGQDFRDWQLERALQEHNSSDEHALFPRSARSTHSQFDLWLYELVEKIGWKPFVQAFRSYSDEQFQQTRDYVYYSSNPLINENGTRNSGELGQVRELLLRVAHFADNPELIQSLTGGERFDERLNVEPMPRERADRYVGAGFLISLTNPQIPENEFFIPITGPNQQDELSQWRIRDFFRNFDMHIYSSYESGIDTNTTRFVVNGKEVETIGDLYRLLEQDQRRIDVTVDYQRRVESEQIRGQ